MENKAKQLRLLFNEINSIKQETFAIIDEIKQMNAIVEKQAIESNINKNNNSNDTKSNNNNGIIKFKEQLIGLNIGGEIFQTTKKTVLSHPNSLFYNILSSNEFKKEGIVNSTDDQIEFFIDRSPKYFKFILSYLRNKTIDKGILHSLKSHEIKEIMKEAHYYSLDDLKNKLSPLLSDVKYIRFEIKKFNNRGNTTFDNNIEDLNDFNNKSLMTGLRVDYSDDLILELERVVEFDKIEIGLYRGHNNQGFSASNGVSSSIFTSLDKELWSYIGSIPFECSLAPVVINVLRSKCKYIQFSNNFRQIGIGYCRIII